MHYKHKKYKFQNIILLVLSLLLLFYFAESTIVENTIKKIGDLGYVGMFITGIFFVSTFTVAPAGLVLFKFAEIYHPGVVALVAGTGSILGDIIIFRFVKDAVFSELKPLYDDYAKKHFKILFHTKYFGWLAPVFGAIIIASPFPDELGITLIGISKLKTSQFLLLVGALDYIGIFIIALIASRV